MISVKKVSKHFRNETAIDYKDIIFEDGKSYHVDATPHRITNMEHFKMTESVITDYTNRPAIINYRPNYYVYDHTLPEYQNIEIAQ